MSRETIGNCLSPAAGLLLLASLAFASPTVAAEGKVTIAITSDVGNLDPTLGHGLTGWPVRLNVFDSLTDIAPDGSMRPQLATSWESTPDATSWTFTIRRDAKFHNGEPVTVDDVIWSIQKVMDDPKTPTRTYVTVVKSIDRVSDDKVRFNLNMPFAVFDRQIMIMRILPKKAYEQMGLEQFGKAPIGSGPYKLVRWVKDDRVELEAFDGYWGDKPTVKTAIIRPIPSEAARAAALISGEVDIVPNLPPAQASTMTGKPGIKVEITDSYKTVFMGFNPANASLKDVKIRKAIDHAIDRDAITQRLLRNMGTPVAQIMAPVSNGYDASLKPSSYDVELARRLVKESGYQGEKISLQYPNDFIVGADGVAQAVAGYLNAVGINVDLQGSEYSSFYALWQARKLGGMHLFVFGPILRDADVPIFSIFATSGQRGYMFDPRVDELADKQRAEADPAKRRKLISDLFKTSNEYQPFVYLYAERVAAGIRDNVNWKVGPDGIVRLLDVSLKAK